MATFPSIMTALFIAAALSLDAFVSSFAYGTNKIKIPFSSVMVINIICSASLAISLLFGAIFRPHIPPGTASLICFIILFTLGIIKVFDSTTKAIIRKYNKLDKRLRFSLFNFHFILNIYANPEEADLDASHILSPVEAAYLSIALSLDGLAVGFGTALTNVNYALIILFSLICNMAAVIFGSHVGNKIAEKLALNLAWLSGLILIILAFTKL